MKPKKPSQPSKEDIERQKEIDKRIKAEKVVLNHPQGKERFEQVIKRALKKNR
ncbi:MAG: hypothetical protein WBP22_04250 [Candidatus Saccharimonas sp.]